MDNHFPSPTCAYQHGLLCLSILIALCFQMASSVLAEETAGAEMDSKTVENSAVDGDGVDAGGLSPALSHTYFAPGQNFWDRTVEMGTHRQDAVEGAEPLLWQFYNVDGDKVYLISYFIIDFFHIDEEDETEWLDTELHHYIDDYLFRSIIPDDLSSAIYETKNGRFYLLDMDSVQDPLYGFDLQWNSIANTTEIASTLAPEEGNTWWLLPEYDEATQRIVYPYMDQNGTIRIDLSADSIRGVRIACCVDINKVVEYNGKHPPVE